MRKIIRSSLFVSTFLLLGHAVAAHGEEHKSSIRNPENATLIIIDYQPETINGLKTIDPRKLVLNHGATHPNGKDLQYADRLEQCQR